MLARVASAVATGARAGCVIVAALTFRRVEVVGVDAPLDAIQEVVVQSLDASAHRHLVHLFLLPANARRREPATSQQQRPPHEAPVFTQPVRRRTVGRTHPVPARRIIPSATRQHRTEHDRLNTHARPVRRRAEGESESERGSYLVALIGSPPRQPPSTSVLNPDAPTHDRRFSGCRTCAPPAICRVSRPALTDASLRPPIFQQSCSRERSAGGQRRSQRTRIVRRGGESEDGKRTEVQRRPSAELKPSVRRSGNHTV